MATRILLVDDEPLNHDLLGVYLQDAGYEIACASDGEQALELLDAGPFDLVLLDVQMPRRDGFSTLAAIRARPELANLPVLLLTALGQTWQKVRGLELGAEDYLAKGGDPAELLARVKTALRRAARYRDPAAAMEGTLGPVRLADLLQTVEAGGRAARLLLPDVDGEIVVRVGVVLRARQGRFEGAQAFARLLLLERGRFRLLHEEPAEGAEPLQRLVSLLMATLATVDELRRDLDAWAPGDPPVAAGDLTGLPELAPLQGRAGLRLAEAVAAQEGELKDAAARLKRAVETGAVQILDRAGER